MCPRKAWAVTVSEEDRLWLERVVMDDDRDEALEFVKKVVHRQIEGHEKGLLQSHLDTRSNPTAAFRDRQQGT
ncbi:MAG: hypothetical protein IBX62_00965 [Coriobacteriia bacterium]|nr:hypothetical protein [Coriobacteriia bacterium]